MANTKQAKKRAAQNEKRKARNRSVKTAVRGKLKELRTSAESAIDKAKELLPTTVSALDRAVRKGVLHEKTAARLKSRATINVTKKAAAKT